MASRGSVRRLFPDRTEDRHVPVDDHLGELLEAVTHFVQAAVVVHGDRHADLGGRDHVHVVRYVSNTWKRRRRKPCASAIRVR